VAPASQPHVTPTHAAPEFGAYGDVPEPIKRKSNAGIIAAIVAVVLIGGAVAYFMTRKSAPAAAPAATNTIAAASTTTAPLGTVPLTSTTTTTGTAATSTGIDPTAVDAEVQKRLAAERARLEAAARAQQQAAAQTQTAAPARPTPAPAQQQAQVPPPVAAPVQEAPRPVPTATLAPEPAVAETRPPPAAPAPQRAREGDLIAAGTEGLTPPHITRRGTVPYPPMARMQKVEGTVITSVLVSETGNVMEVRILRGVSRAVGLNEAAQQAMRRSSFQPGSKDGVRVKAWVTVPVEFKL
jgi:protein TonB